MVAMAPLGLAHRQSLHATKLHMALFEPQEDNGGGGGARVMSGGTHVLKKTYGHANST